MITVLLFVGVLSFLILIHEGGHLLAAKLSGVWVHQFAIGFGPDLAKFESGETTYSLKPILFGGYVKMAGEDISEDGDVDEEVPEGRKYYAQNPLRKIFIASSGPLMNVLAAILIMIFLVGSTGVPTIGVYDILSDSPSREVLSVGDRILGVGGRQITSIRDINAVIQQNEDTPVTVTLRGEEGQKEVTVTPKYYAEEGRYMLGVSLGPAGNTRIAHVREDSVFRQAGLRPGDRVLQVGDRTVSSWAEFLSLFREDDKSSPLELTVERGEQESQLELPRTVVRSEVLESLSPEIIRRSIGPVTSIRLGLDQIRTILIVTYQGLRMVIAGDVPAREAVSGPVGIANYLGQGLEQGIYSLFTMIALISLNLGIINLIPFPALDGSRIGFALYEGLRGRPIPPEREGFIHTIGFVILLALLIFLTYQDILRLIS